MIPNTIKFHKDVEDKLHITFHCTNCNTYEDITELVDTLCGYGQDNCPQDLHIAWKILRLGTTVYSGIPGYEHNTIQYAKSSAEMKGGKKI